MNRLEGELRRMWRGERGLTPLLMRMLAALPAAVFSTGVLARNALYELGVLRSHAATMPVISVGNLAVGGVGKTPVAAWIVRELRALGWKPALVTRGYGDDEIRLHRKWNPDVPVIQASRRISGAGRAHAQGRDVVVLDDGFQHRGITRDVDIVLLSPAHRLPARPLPLGPYRESLNALRRADYILITVKGEHEREEAERLAERLSLRRAAPPVEIFPFRVGTWHALDGSVAPCPSGPPLAVTSVAEPEAFLRMIERVTGGPVAHLRFPDHHPFDRGDAERIRREAGDGWVATTEKDAVKLHPLSEALPECRVLPLIPDPRPGLANRMLGRLAHPAAREEGR